MSKFIQSSWAKLNKTFEIPLRPQSLEEFVGQESILKRLEIFIGAAIKRGDALSHMLFFGPPGLGKTTLATIIAKKMGTNMITTSGPVIEKPGDLAGLLTNLKKGDILFIDETHRLAKCVEEYLYVAMEDFVLNLLIDSGPSARTVQIKLNPFTLIGATTRSGLLSNPLRSRFIFKGRLDYYKSREIKKIIFRSAKILNIDIDDAGANIIATRARGTPRVANNLLRWVRDYVQMNSSENDKIDNENAQKALNMLGIDEEGLDEIDKKILTTIVDHYDGGPVGIKTLGVAVGEDPITIEEIYEPYLIEKGFLKRTPTGRKVTNLTYKHIRKNHGDLL